MDVENLQESEVSMSLKNWKKERAQRIADAKAGKRERIIMDTTKVDDRSKEFLAYAEKLLETHGVKSKEIRDQCCYELFETMTRSFKVATLDPGKDQDKFLMEMADALAKAGIVTEMEQEHVIIKFLEKFKSISGL
jgi:hypothetical protein